MNTIRELLFKRHRPAGPKLDDLRRNVLEQLSRASIPGLTDAGLNSGLGTEFMGHKPEPIATLRQLIWSCRWHIAALSAAWCLVAILSFGPAPGQPVTVAGPSRPSARELVLALRENRRQLLEWLGTIAVDTVAAPGKPGPSRRSQAVPAITLV